LVQSVCAMSQVFVHVPLEQTSPLGHGALHAPQLALSVLRLAQMGTPLSDVHFAWELEHEPLHDPP
jgi:hypothetical protein